MFRVALFQIFFFLLFPASAQQFLVRPYIQPGNVSDFSKEEKVLIWQTDDVPGDFAVTYNCGHKSASKGGLCTAKISSVNLDLGGSKSILYRAVLNRLSFDTTYIYNVQLNGKTVGSSFFRTRSTQSHSKFVVFGDCCTGTKDQAAIAYQIYREQPEFVMIAGDVVYQTGLEKEYLTNFFPYYLAKEASHETGAPLMNNIPFYNVIGNHDVLSANLDRFPDGLAYFYYNDLPMNAPTSGTPITLQGNSQAVRKFKANTRPRFPSMTNYSFYYGNVFILALDSNPYANPLDPVLLDWVKKELQGSKADWKIVVFHHPGFNSNRAHHDDQIMRLLSPVMEKLNVDLVISGHVHDYQRSVPLLFDPKLDETGTKYVISPEGRVDGTFTLDTKFDGSINTHPNGIIYIISGAGGAPLYDEKGTDNPSLWLNGPKSKAPFTAKLVSDRHSFTLIETNKNELILQQVDKEGKVFDRIRLTK